MIDQPRRGRSRLRKCGRKRENAALNADEPEAEPKEFINGKRKRGWKRKSAIQEADRPKPEQEVA